MRKTLLAVLAASALIFSLTACGGIGNDPNAKYFTYEVNETSDTYSYTPEGITITGYTADNSEIRVPAFIDGRPVTGIGIDAFSDVYAERIILPEGIQVIYPDAFSSNLTLKNVLLPSTLEVIYNASFGDCSALTEITIPEKLTEIRLGVFQNCTSLFRAELPDGLTVIGNQAFMDCASLEEAVIPSTVTEIGGYAYSGCSSLESVTMSEGLLSIGSMCFNDCAALKEITVPDTATIYSDAFNGCFDIKVNYRGITYSYGQLSEIYVEPEDTIIYS